MTEALKSSTLCPKCRNTGKIGLFEETRSTQVRQCWTKHGRTRRIQDEPTKNKFLKENPALRSCIVHDSESHMNILVVHTWRQPCKYCWSSDQHKSTGCDRCEGTGVFETLCKECRGTGSKSVEVVERKLIKQVDCPDCSPNDTVLPADFKLEAAAPCEG